MIRYTPLLGLALCAAKLSGPVVWWESALPSTMHPLYAASTLDLRAQALVYDRLLRPAPKGWESAVLASAALEGGTATLKLRQDVRWHDGERLKAEQVCESIAALRSTEHRSPLGARLGSRLQHCTVHPSQPWTVVVHLANTADPRPWEALSIPLLPTHLEGDLADPDHAIAETPVGSGPWSATSDAGGWLYTATTSAHHQPNIPSLALRVREPNASAVADLDKRASGWPVVPAQAVSEIREMKGWTLHDNPRQVLLQIALDSTGGPTANVALRQELDLALDRFGLCYTLVGPPPDDGAQPCIPVSGPFASRSDAYNHGIPVPEPVRPAPEEPVTLVLGLVAEIEVDADALARSIEDAWFPHQVSWEIVSFREVWSLTATERRERWDALVVQRTPATNDLRPELAISGGLNWFDIADPEILPFLGSYEPADLRTLHAVLADRRHHLYLFELGGLAAWRSQFDPAWMTTTDGLGALSRWGVSEDQQGRHRPRRDSRDQP